MHGRGLAIMHVAMFEALNAIERRYTAVSAGPGRRSQHFARSRRGRRGACGADQPVSRIRRAGLDALLEQQLAAVP